MSEAASESAGATQQPDRPDVFISYARADKQFVETRLVASLTARGKDVWIDLEDIPPAADWRERIWDGIDAARAVVVVLSPASIGSKVCQEELRRAIEANKRLVPVLRIDVDAASVPDELRRPNWILLRDSDDFDVQFKRLVEALDTDLEWVDRHARLAVRAREWGRAGEDRSLLLRGSDLQAAERWLAEQSAHAESATGDQSRYIVASRHAASRRQRITLGAVSAALLISLGLGVLALLQRNNAVTNEQTARSRELAGSALLALPSDPELGVALAREANGVSPTGQALDALRQSLERWAARGAFPHPGGKLQQAVYSPNGKLVLTANGRSTRIWDASTRRMLTELPDAGRITGPARFSPNSRAVLTSRGPTLTVSVARTGRRIRALTFPDDVDSARFSGDGWSLLVVRGIAADVLRWPSARRVATLTARGWDLDSADISRDARFVLGWGSPAPGHRTYRAFLWRMRDRHRVATVVHRAPIGAAALGPRGDVFVTASDDNRAELWRVRPARRVRILRESNDVTAASFSADGRAVLTSSVDGTTRVWKTSGRGRVAILKGTTAGGAFHTASAFSPGGQRVATTDDSGGLRIWDVASRRPILDVIAHPGRAVSATFSPDGSSVLTAGAGGQAREWRAGPDAREVVLRERDERVNEAEFDPSGRKVLTAGGDGFARLWDVRSGRLLRRLGDHGAPVEHVTFADSGRLAVGVDANGATTVSRTATGRRLARLPERLPVRGDQGSRTGALVLLTTRDGRAAIWNARTRRRIAELRRGGGEPISSAVFTRDLRFLVTTGIGTPTRVWDVGSGDEVSVLGGEGTAAYGAAVSPDGRFIVNAESHGPRVYETESGGRARSLPGGRTTGDADPMFSRDGATLVTGNAIEQRVRVIDWAGRRLLADIRTPNTGAPFSDRGTYLATVAGRVARMWEARTGQRVATLSGLPAGAVVALNSDGTHLLVTRKAGGLARLVACEVCRSRQGLVALAQARGARALSPDERERYLHK